MSDHGAMPDRPSSEGDHVIRKMAPGLWHLNPWLDVARAHAGGWGYSQIKAMPGWMKLPGQEKQFAYRCSSWRGVLKIGQAFPGYRLIKPQINDNLRCFSSLVRERYTIRQRQMRPDFFWFTPGTENGAGLGLSGESESQLETKPVVEGNWVTSPVDRPGKQIVVQEAGDLDMETRLGYAPPADSGGQVRTGYQRIRDGFRQALARIKGGQHPSLPDASVENMVSHPSQVVSDSVIQPEVLKHSPASVGASALDSGSSPKSRISSITSDAHYPFLPGIRFPEQVAQWTSRLGSGAFDLTRSGAPKYKTSPAIMEASGEDRLARSLQPIGDESIPAIPEERIGGMPDPFRVSTRAVDSGDQEVKSGPVRMETSINHQAQLHQATDDWLFMDRSQEHPGRIPDRPHISARLKLTGILTTLATKMKRAAGGDEGNGRKDPTDPPVPTGLSRAEISRVKLDAERGAGRQVPVWVRSRLARILRQDIPEAVLHQGRQAKEISGNAKAEAATSGQHIFLSPDAGPLDQPRGLALLAHELVHVGQPRRASPSSLQREKEERAAESVERYVFAAAQAVRPAAHPDRHRELPLRPRSSQSPVQGTSAVRLAARESEVQSPAQLDLPRSSPPDSKAEEHNHREADVEDLAERVYQQLVYRLKLEREQLGL